MLIEYYGHASFGVTTKEGVRIVFDPYEPGGFGGAVGLDPIGDAADVAICSHGHADHGYVESVGGDPQVVRGTGEHAARGLKIRGVKTFHDDSGGSQRGENTVFALEADGLRLVHLGDLGHLLDEKQVAEIGPVDVLLIPVGGTFTIDAGAAQKVVESLNPRLVIPMHYKNPKVKFPLADVEDFARGMENVKRLEKSRAEIGELPGRREVWILKPSR